MFSGGGTKRFRDVRDAVRSLRCHSAVIDGELTACDTKGKPDFVRLVRRRNLELCVRAFDLMRFDGLRMKPLWERKRELQRIILEADEYTLRFSADFDDPMKLLAGAEQWKLESVVSKKLDQPYKSGQNLGWVKVKTASWRVENVSRWKLFQRQG